MFTAGQLSAPTPIASSPVFQVYKLLDLRYKRKMRELVIKSYADLGFHKTIGKLIKEHSENKEDIRDVAIKLVDLTKVLDILDLGCGYGWFEEALPSGFRSILGIDYLEANEQSFLSVAKRVAEQSRFKQTLLPAPIDKEADTFDLIISAYSLYFFPDMLPEVRRVLRPGGTFLIITHSASMMEEGEEFFDFSNLRKVINNFSAENGNMLLKKHFDYITEVDYINSLVFIKEAKDALAKYIDFKKEFISKDVSPVVVKAKMIYELEKRGLVKFNKNDRIFVARK